MPVKDREQMEFKHNMHSAVKAKMYPTRYTSYLCKNQQVSRGEDKGA